MLAAVAALSACTGDKQTGDGGGTVIVAMASDPSSAFPLLTQEEIGRAVTDVLFEKLAKIGPDLSAVGDAGFTPRLAKSWDWARDSMSIVFHLDPTARFHDGTPVTANDVRYSFRIAKDTTLGSQTTQLIENVDSVSVLDSLTPVVWFKKRSPTQFYDAVYQVAPVPEHIYGKVPVADLKTSDITRTPVGTGRFRFVKWEPGVRFEVVADTTNFRGRAKLDRVIFMLNQAGPAAAASMLAGQSDFLSAFPIDQADQLDSASAVRTMGYSQNGYGFLAINTHARKSPATPHPILGDIAVRRALSMSLDRQSMLTNIFKGAGRLSYGPFPSGAQLSDTTIAIPPYDTVAAGAALDAAGWRRGANGVRMKNGRPLALEIMVPSVSPPRLRYAELIQDQLNRAGFQIAVAKVAPPQFIPRHQSGDFDLDLYTLFTDPHVPGIQQFWSGAALATRSSAARYQSPIVDATLDSATRVTDARQVRLYASRAFQRIVDDVPAVWLYTAGSIAAVNNRIETAPFGLDGWWGNLADWSIPAGKRIDRDRIGLRPAAP